MAKKITKHDSSKTVKLVAIGAGVAVAAAAAYFFLGPDGKKHQRHAKSWAIKMKGEVIEKLEQAKEVSEPVYHQIIDAVAAEFTKAGKVDHGEVSQLAADLKKHWKTLVGANKAKA